jgi:hypothetical protein
MLTLARKSGEMDGLLAALTGLAAAAAGRHQPERSARLDGAAQSIGETAHVILIDRAPFDPHIQIAREQLGQEIFSALQAEGRAMSRERAVLYALERDHTGQGSISIFR